MGGGRRLSTNLYVSIAKLEYYIFFHQLSLESQDEKLWNQAPPPSRTMTKYPGPVKRVPYLVLLNAAHERVSNSTYDFPSIFSTKDLKAYIK